LKEYDK